MEKGRMKRTAESRMEALGFTQIHVYQPQSLFVQNGRKLPRCAEPGDPWLMFATQDGICYHQAAADPMGAAERIIAVAIFPEFTALGAALDMLTDTLRAG